MDLQSMFDHLVDLTEPICQRIDIQKASMLLFDTSGIEAWVTEKQSQICQPYHQTAESLQKKQMDWMTPSPLIKLPTVSMPSHTAANPAIRQMYINGHFCYAFKFGIVTKRVPALSGISAFYNKGLSGCPPGLSWLEKKSGSPGRG